MAGRCLFEINATGTYADCCWLAAISIGLIFGQVIILAPLIKPTAQNTIDFVKSYSEQLQDKVTGEEAREQPEQTEQTNVTKDVEKLEMVSISPTEIQKVQKELELKMGEYWKEYQQTFNIFGLNFTGYVMVVSVACVFVLLGTIFLIYSVDDPREIWQNEGWKHSINLSTMLIVIVSEANGFMLSMTKSTVNAVLMYYEETNATRLFKLIYWVSIITKIVFFCIYYPYIVAALLNMLFMGAVAIAICISCGGCCTVCCAVIILYGLFYGLFSCLLCPLRMFMEEEKLELVRYITVFCVLEVVLVYGLTVVVTIIIFAVTGGIDNADFCIHDNVKSLMAVVWMEIGPVIGLISGVVGCFSKFCKGVKGVQGGTMTLKTTENEEKS